MTVHPVSAAGRCVRFYRFTAIYLLVAVTAVLALALADSEIGRGVMCR